MKPEIISQFDKILAGLPEGSTAHAAAAELVEKFQEFFHLLETSRDEDIETLMHEFSRAEQPLLQGLGKLVRKFHDQISTVSTDVRSRLGDMVENEMVSASQRLGHIVKMTEEAATTTMNLTEAMLETSRQLEAEHAQMLDSLTRTLEAGGLPESAEAALKDAVATLQQQSGAHPTQRQRLTDIVMAQGYQDLTGQMVHKVIRLLNQLEGELLELVRAHVSPAEPGEGHGAAPAAAGAADGEDGIRYSQEDADDLLKSLGF